jgi:hypothetical protein
LGKPVLMASEGSSVPVPGCAVEVDRVALLADPASVDIASV